MTQTPSIVEFLAARYDEDERRAETAASQASFIAVPDNDEGDPGRWCATEDGTGVTTENAYSGEPFLLMPQGYVESEVAEYVAAVGDPARVLADIAAKRRVLGRHGSYEFPADEDDGPGDYAWTPSCDHCFKSWPCPDLRDLAASYAEHPDYKPAWRIKD